MSLDMEKWSQLKPSLIIRQWNGSTLVMDLQLLGKLKEEETFLLVLC